MSQRAGSRARGYLSRGALLSLLLHVHLLTPIGLAVWVFGGPPGGRAGGAAGAGGRRRVQGRDRGRAAQGPAADRAGAARSARAAQAAAPRAEARKPEQKLAEKKAEDKAAEKPLPEARAGGRRAAAAASRSERKAHEKMVDLDNDKEVEPPPDAKYLAQKNNRADEETRANDTNLQKAQKGEAAASDKSDRDDPEPGADKQKIAELEDKKSALGRRAPDVTPHDNPEVAQKDERRRAQVAAGAARSRQAAARADARDREPVAAQRRRRRDRAGRAAVRGANSDPSRLKNGERVKLALSDRDFEYLFGADAEAERRLAQTQKSTRQGKFAAQRRARARRAGELHSRGQAGQPDRAEHARRAVRRVHREDAPEHSQAVGLRRAGGLGRAAQLQPAQRPQAVDDAGDGDEPRRHRRQGHGRARLRLPAVRRGGDRRRVQRRPVSRSAARDPVGQRQDLRPLAVPPRRAPVRDLGRRLLHPRQPARGRGPIGRRRRAVRGAPSGRGRRPPRAARARRPRARRPPAANAQAPASATANDGGLRRLRRFDDKRHGAKMQRLDEEVAMAEEQDHDHVTPPPPPPRRCAPAPPAGVRGTDPAARAIARALVQGARRRRRRGAGGDVGAAVQDLGQGRHEASGADRDAQRPGGRREGIGRADGRRLHDRRASRRHRQAARQRRRRHRRAALRARVQRAARGADPDPRQARPATGGPIGLVRR